MENTGFYSGLAAGIGEGSNEGWSDVTNLIGTLIAVNATKGNYEEADRLLKLAAEQFGPQFVPALKQVVAQQLAESQVGKITEDPALRSAQVEALRRMQLEASGQSAETAAEYQLAQNRANQQAQAALGAISRSMAARGMRGSGSDYAAQLAASQGASQRMSEEGLSAAKDARIRALQAMQNQAGMASSLRAADYQKSLNAASAADSIARWNAANRQAIDQYNVGLSQQDYENRLRERMGVSEANRMLAANQWQQAARKRGEIASITGAVSGMTQESFPKFARSMGNFQGQGGGGGEQAVMGGSQGGILSNQQMPQYAPINQYTNETRYGYTYA